MLQRSESVLLMGKGDHKVSVTFVILVAFVSLYLITSAEGAIVLYALHTALHP